MTDENEAVLLCRGVARRFAEGHSVLEVLSGVDLQIARAERVAIIGASGSGKTTLLQILGGLDNPDDGEVFIGGEAMHGGNESVVVSCAIAILVSSISFIICYPNLQRQKTLPCRC